MIKHSVLTLAIVFLFNQDVSAQDVKEREVFNGPERVESPFPRYPSVEAMNGVEGWVVLNFMVDKEGNIFEPSIVDSSGSKQFQKEAMKALKNIKYKPANINGLSVESSTALRFGFSLERDKPGARLWFRKRHNKFVKAIKNDDKEEARRFIDKYEDESNLNNFERAYLNFNRGSYAARYGDKLDEMKYLNRALMYEGVYDDENELLPSELILSARRQLYLAQVTTSYFNEAMRSYYLIKNKHGDEAVSDFQPIHKKMLEILEGDKSYEVSAKTDSSGLWSINLFRPQFAIVSNGGMINELKLRCKKKFVFLAFKEGDHYQIPESWGECHLQVLGAADSEFDLIQL